MVAAADVSDPVPVISGVRQGCPLSGPLFNLAIDLLQQSLGGVQPITAAWYSPMILFLLAILRMSLEDF